MYQNDINVNAVMMERGISATAARVLFEVNRLVNTSRHKGKKDRRGVAYCYASKVTLAAKVGKSERTIARAIAELKAAGLIESRRTTRNAHIYLTYYGTDGTSANANNGTSNNNSIKSYKKDYTSFYHDKKRLTDNKAADDAKSAVSLARIGAASAENVKDEQHKTVKAGKGVPTPKRRNRISKREKQAAKEKYSRLLEQKLDMANFWWLLPDEDIQDEYRRRYGLIDLIAEAMAVPGRQIRVNGAGLTVEQYWNVVQDITPDAIRGIFDRLKTAEVCTGITNVRAYTLASVYNAVQWHKMTSGANISIDAVYRHMG